MRGQGMRKGNNLGEVEKVVAFFVIKRWRAL